eukprot:Blabericola_migrator_1__10866@NODE_625_length_7189_cov_131_220444_g456_i0_p5_GENE_NODE_625_length_7189_cov_131_220444_g456_i0NODE_625_length_7189_cov_131_220444_g456_i0_p5_ORF_typecomplete_len215_score30_24AP2/PF00847_20/5_8e07_NODE_625_length_7189_cov_131_220444_g456_i029093553
MTSSAPPLLPPSIVDSLPSSMSLPQSIVQIPPSFHSAPCPSSSINSLSYSAGMGIGIKDPSSYSSAPGGHHFMSSHHSFFHNSYFLPPSFTSNFARGGIPSRRLSADGLAGGDFASPAAQQLMKKNLSVGDRPLTPPAHGWHAKYSSGVTGVVWDRVHQAWVVSWTLAGKRTFRHFTCKSYGGFEKARDAAIEFRLARNRDIAAYNRRCKDRRA